MKKHVLKKSIGCLSFPLESWGVKKEEIHKTVTSWMDVATKYEIRKWTGLNNMPQGDPQKMVVLAEAATFYYDKKNKVRAEELATLKFDEKNKLKRKLIPTAAVLEEAIFAAYQDDIVSMAQKIEAIPKVMRRFNANPTAFWKRLAKYAEQKSAGRGWLSSQHDWVCSAVRYWIHAPRMPDTQSAPPMCLWADSAFEAFFKGVPKEGNSIRKILKNHGLYRPEGISFRYSGGRWVRCLRRHQRGGTKSPNTVPAS